MEAVENWSGPWELRAYRTYLVVQHGVKTVMHMHCMTLIPEIAGNMNMSITL